MVGTTKVKILKAKKKTIRVIKDFIPSSEDPRNCKFSTF